MKLEEVLVVIPARGGSKGVPRKNIRNLLGRPLIQYSLEFASRIFDKKQICVSTDSDEIISLVKNLGFEVPFKRPDSFASDHSGMREVVLHAAEFYKNLGKELKYILLLQPTSPIRALSDWIKITQVAEGSEPFDMIVSVRESKANPYFNLFEENSNGYLVKSKEGNYLRRQDCPPIYEYNGNLYFVSIESLKNRELNQFEKIIKIVNNDKICNIDIDTQHDWDEAEALIKKYLEKNEIL